MIVGAAGVELVNRQVESVMLAARLNGEPLEWLAKDVTPS